VLSYRFASLPFAAVALLAAGQAFANPYVVGGARFTVVTPECIRLEYQAEGQFIDAPSMFAAGRAARYDGAEVEQSEESLKIDTGRLKLSYTPDGQPFSAANLKVEIFGGALPVEWTPDSKQRGNLGGTINTLDQVKGPVSLEEGILSRDGWYLLDDSRGHLLVDEWVQPRPESAGTDWYLFGYGNDYPSAFRAFTTIGGIVPMPRKSVLGSWYSRWWEYSTEDYKAIVREYAENNFPIDIMVMDMEWHTGPWTGWSWNYDLLPDPPALLRWFHDQGLAVTLNVHPSDGVMPTETMYPEFMSTLGKDPESKEPVEFDAGNKEYMEAYFRITHHPREAEGVDFWWLDWQQYPEVKSIPGLLNLSWLNKLYFDNSMRNGRRGLQFSRWGAWGDHRHPIHFSGDADTGWPMLGFEVPFTSTAANEGAYFWSHDIGGHFGDRNEEPYTRWVQFAATTAAMRIHSGIIPYLDRRPWTWPDWATASMRRSFHLRSRLMPYVYSAVRQTHETGLPLNRPMYIEWPAEEDAYRAPQQYLFGSDLLVAPVASAGFGPGRVASQAVWFPRGEWRNFFTGESFTGPRWELVSADIDEFPLYARTGVPIPMQPYSPRPTSAKLDKLVLMVWPGMKNDLRSFTLYEDDGDTRAYETGAFAKTLLSSILQDNLIQVTVHPSEGEYEGQVPERSYEIMIGGVEEPNVVTLDGKPVTADWSSEKRRVVVRIPARSILDGATVVVDAALTPPAFFAERALERRMRGLLGEDSATSNLAAAIKEANASQSPALPGLVAMAGVGLVENGTHYPEVGTLLRLVRNADSPIAAEGLALSWKQTITRRGDDIEETEHEGIIPEDLKGIAELRAPAFKVPELAFMEAARTERSLSFSLDGENITITTPTGATFGQARDWFVSPTYPFDRERPIDEQKYEPEVLSPEDLASGEPLDGWVEVSAEETGIVNLLKARGGEDVLAYAVTTVELDAARDVTLGFRSDDGIEVWLNGEKIHSKSALRGINHSWEEVPASFRQGRNVLLVKVTQAEYDWGFIVVGREREAKP